jgi:hypothetical protein
LLQINKNYALGSDELNVILYKTGVTKEGKTPGKRYDRILGYFSTAESALKALVDIEIKGTGLKDFETVVNRIQELKELTDGLGVKNLPP